MSDAWMVIQADCVEAMRGLPENSVDSIVTDPPYGLEFMGKEFDKLGEGPAQQAWHLRWATEALRVLKPGGHLVAFGGTRTYHRLACALEDAGFEIRDSLTFLWVYGTGFPKSLNVSKALDKAVGAERTEVRPYIAPDGKPRPTVVADWAYADARGEAEGANRREASVSAPASDLAKQWDGWGTALKPAFEPIVLARKPLEGTVAKNVQKWGTGALNIDATRIGIGDEVSGGGANFDAWRGGEGRADRPAQHGVQQEGHNKGRWPANVVLDKEAGALLDAQSGTLVSGSGKKNTRRSTGEIFAAVQHSADDKEFAGDSGGASRFFYCAKTSRKERGEGNNHPTVKPIALMRWLIRLVTPPNGSVLDPFCGSGSTGLAALQEGLRFIGLEREPAYASIAKKRLSEATAIPPP